MVGGIDMLDAHRQGGAPMREESAPRGFGDIAVLYRTHRQASLLEECFQKEGIPYNVAGRESYLTDKAVRTALAFFRSLQSGSDTVLKRMNRKYDTARYLESVRLLHRYFPGCAITTDLIVGFPGETVQEFSQSVSFLQTCELAAVHVFPYSRRKGTPAASMPDQIEKAEKERRAAVAGETAAALHRAYLARQLGTEHDVLFEQTEKGYFTGHTMNYVKVYCDAENLRNEIRRVRITALFEDGVLAEPVFA